MADSQLGIHILGPTYFGVRQVGLKPDKKINTPADMAGIKLRMPGGEAWQFLGSALGANPTPMAYAEVYTGLQTGRDRRAGQSAAERREHEVLRGDVADRADLAPRRLRSPDRLRQGLEAMMSADQQAAFQAAADKALAWNTEQHLKREAELVEVFKGKGLHIYTPDVEAFRKHVQETYLESDLAKSWPARHGRQDQRALACRSVSAGDARASPANMAEGRSRCSARRERWLRRRAENVSVVAARHDVRRAHRAGRLPLFRQHADGLDRRAQPHHVDLARALGRGLRRARERRDPLRAPPCQRAARASAAA